MVVLNDKTSVPTFKAMFRLERYATGNLQTVLLWERLLRTTLLVKTYSYTVYCVNCLRCVLLQQVSATGGMVVVANVSERPIYSYRFDPAYFQPERDVVLLVAAYVKADRTNMLPAEIT